MLSNFLNSKASFELIRKFISEEEEQILLEKHGIEFVSYYEYETLEELLEAWGKGIKNLKTQFVFHENNPVFKPLRKYFYTYFRDVILQNKYPEFDESVIVLDERHWFESNTMESIFESVKNIFFIDPENPYLYNFTEDKTSSNVKQYLADISKRNSVFQDDDNSLTKEQVALIYEKVKKEKSDKKSKFFKQKGDEYFSLDESIWLRDAKSIFFIIFNPYINSSYRKSLDDIGEMKNLVEYLIKL